MFDEAVAWFGQWVEDRLSERSKDGKPLYSLDQLLGTREYQTYKMSK